jgi:copper transport protein
VSLSPTLRRTLRRLGLVVAVVAGITVGTAPAASAHPTLLATTPQAGYSVAAPPTQITLVFDEPVKAHLVRLLDQDGHEQKTSPITPGLGGRQLTVRVLAPLSTGRYVVRWQVTAQDGDVVDSGFDFAVGSGAAGLRGHESTQTAGLPVVAALRWLLFISLAATLGTLVGEWLAHRAAPSARKPRPVIGAGLLLGLLAVGGLLAHLAATVGAGGRAGALLITQPAAFAAAAILYGRTRRRYVAAILLVVVAAEGLRNHLGTQHGLLGAALMAAHLTAGAVWVGALVHLLRAAHTNHAVTPVLPAFRDYARLAVALFATVVLTGTIAALQLIPTTDALTSTGYGQALVVKLAVFTIATALAWTNSRRLALAPHRLTRTARTEAVTLVTVLAVTATLVSLPTPAPATTDIGYPPPATGPTLRLGTLAGQVAVSIAASENQLEVRLRIPDDRIQLGEANPPQYQLTTTVRAPDGTPTTITLNPCGPGCYVGPMPWRTGTSQLDLHTTAAGWNGGAATFPIHWPARTTAGILPRIRAALHREQRLHLVETVTSDTSRPTPPPHTLTATSEEFLDGEPYASPPDPPTVVHRNPDKTTTVTFGLAAEGINVQLVVDSSYRILSETLAAPKHLTQRTFTYG